MEGNSQAEKEEATDHDRLTAGREPARRTASRACQSFLQGELVTGNEGTSDDSKRVKKKNRKREIV